MGGESHSGDYRNTINSFAQFQRAVAPKTTYVQPKPAPAPVAAPPPVAPAQPTIAPRPVAQAAPAPTAPVKPAVVAPPPPVQAVKAIEPIKPVEPPPPPKEADDRTLRSTRGPAKENLAKAINQIQNTRNFGNKGTTNAVDKISQTISGTPFFNPQSYKF